MTPSDPDVALPSAPKRGTRPPLTAETSLDDFRGYYWYLSDLVAFCRQNGLNTVGQKAKLMERVASFLASGKRDARPDGRGERGTARAATPVGSITRDTPVTVAYKCDAQTRAFFKSVIGPHFHFTAHQQQFRREAMAKGVMLTYGDLVDEWIAEQKRRMSPNYKSRIARSWQYNQFVRDFMADKQHNRGLGIAAAAKAWNLVREHKGPHTYAEYYRLWGGN